MNVRTDFHIHTAHVGCADETMVVADIVNRCEELGMQEIAITDHLNNLSFLDKHRKIKEDILELTNDITIFFGVELNYDGYDGEFAITDQAQEELCFQFMIGGIHGAYGADRKPEEILETQHMHHIKTCNDPRVSVLVHPYWFGGKDYEQMPWLTDLSLVKDEWIEELAKTALATETAIEINGCAIFKADRFPQSYKDSYVDYIDALKGFGVKFSVASDAHNIDKLAFVEAAEEVVDKLAIPEEQIWRPQIPDIRQVAK